jgi:hypothetical protein
MMFRPLSVVALSLVLFSCGSPPPAAPKVASLSTPESPGANCASGGTRFQFGIDDDGDGTLEAAEVESTQYVCNTGAFSNVYFGNLTLTSAADIQAAQGYTGILGTLRIEPQAVSPATTVDVTLPNLRFVQGDVFSGCGLANDESDARTWSFPELEIVTGAFSTSDCNPLLESISAPKLTRSGPVSIWFTLLTSLSLPSLRELFGNAELNADNNASLSSCDVIGIVHTLRLNGWDGSWSAVGTIDCTSAAGLCRTIPVGSNSTDFRLCYTDINWPSAKTLCESIGPNWGLLYLTSDAERVNLIDSAFSPYSFWTAYNDEAVINTWVWDRTLTGNTYAPQSYTDGDLWIDGEPNGDDIENCAEFHSTGETGQLNDSTCDVANHKPACRYLAP